MQRRIDAVRAAMKQKESSKSAIVEQRVQSLEKGESIKGKNDDDDEDD